MQKSPVGSPGSLSFNLANGKYLRWVNGAGTDTIGVLTVDSNGRGTEPHVMLLAKPFTPERLIDFVRRGLAARER